MQIEHFTGELAASGVLRAVGTPERPICHDVQRRRHLQRGAEQRVHPAIDDPPRRRPRRHPRVDGTPGPGFVTGNTFDDVSGCEQTRPWVEGQSCPDPEPPSPTRSPPARKTDAPQRGTSTGTKQEMFVSMWKFDPSVWRSAWKISML